MSQLRKSSTVAPWPQRRILPPAFSRWSSASRRRRPPGELSAGQRQRASCRGDRPMHRMLTHHRIPSFSTKAARAGLAIFGIAQQHGFKFVRITTLFRFCTVPQSAALRCIRLPSDQAASIGRVHGMVNIGLPLAVADAGTSSCITSQCSTSFPSRTRKMSTATSGFSAQPI